MNTTTLNMTTLDGGVIIKKGGGGSTPPSGGESGGSDTLYFAAKDGGAMGYVSEMFLTGGFAVKKADNTIFPVGMFVFENDNILEETLSLKAVALVLGKYSIGDEVVDLSNPDTLRGKMFIYNGIEGLPEIIEITKEQFYSLD